MDRMNRPGQSCSLSFQVLELEGTFLDTENNRYFGDK